MNKMILKAGLGSVLALSAHLACAQVAVIVNPKSPNAALTPEQVSGIYLGKVSTFPSGATAVLANMPEGSPTYETFYSKATGKSVSQVKSTWSRLVFSGKAALPKELPSADEVKKFVAGNADAIGYIDKAAVDASVKVVLSVD